MERKEETFETTEIPEGEVIPVTKAEMEFRLINPTEDGFLRTIQWNRQELEAAIRQKMSQYEGVVYTEDTIQQAKSDRAELNKLTKAIEERRKAVKNIIMEPYMIFESEVKDILELIKRPAAMIDDQIKGYENLQRDEKKKKIRAVYEEVIGDLASVLPFEKVFDSRYLNKTYALKTAQDEVRGTIERVRTDLETIDSLDSKYKLNAKDVYIRTLDLSKALAENKRLTKLEEELEAEKKRRNAEEAERKRIAEERRKAEEERKAQEAENERLIQEEKRRQAEQTAQEDKQSCEAAKLKKYEKPLLEEDNTMAAVDPFATKAEPEKTVKKYRTRFCAIGTKEQLTGLIEYMKNNNIEYGRIK